MATEVEESEVCRDSTQGVELDSFILNGEADARLRIGGEVDFEDDVGFGEKLEKSGGGECILKVRLVSGKDRAQGKAESSFRRGVSTTSEERGSSRYPCADT